MKYEIMKYEIKGNIYPYLVICNTLFAKYSQNIEIQICYEI